MDHTLEAAVKAPNGGNQQIARFLVVNDPATIHEFGTLYREAWWAKRRDEGFEQWADLPERFHPTAGLADAMGGVSCIVFALPLAARCPRRRRIPLLHSLGYPRGNFGPNVRKPTAETTFLDRWGTPVPWR